MKKLRNAIIHKLGGITFDDVASNVGAIKDYWAHECIRASLRVDKDHFDKRYTESIETEIAHKLAENMLKMGHIGFWHYRTNYDEVEIVGQTHVLRVKKPTSAHMPSHLKFEKEKNDGNESQ